MSSQSDKGPAGPDNAETRKRTAAEIEADLEARRADLTRSVDAMMDRLNPRNQATRFVERVKAGEPRAVTIVGGTAVVVVGLVGVVILRKSR